MFVWPDQRHAISIFSNGGSPMWMVDNGKSENKMDDLAPMQGNFQICKIRHTFLFSNLFDGKDLFHLAPLG
jgi:hypothetical protein